MKYKELGASGIEVSVIGLGCWAFGGGAYWGPQSQRDADAVVAAAIERGVNFIDTAEIYNDGESERSLGLALKGRRDKVVLASKISTAHAGEVRKYLEGSLARLGTDYLDLYILHWPINPTALAHFTGGQGAAGQPPQVAEVFAQFEALRKEGLIRSIGLSNFGVRQMEEVAATGVRADSNQLAYNIVSRAIETEIAPYCVAHQIGVTGSVGLQQGLLTGKYAKPEDVPPPQAHSRHFHQDRGGKDSRHYEDGAEKELFDALDCVKAISAETGLSCARISLAWILQKPFMTSTLVGCRNLAQLDANLGAADVALSDELMARIDAASLPVWQKLGDTPDYYENRGKSRIF
ncbi:MAG: aldo/keto reductase [Candidatus Accumulibacter sp.]|jgi:aryl-alcohol dehydrogenase-like predicted oxidoreductase|nr:aldo/keto reductase [Accumulibacter sp.]